MSGRSGRRRCRHGCWPCCGPCCCGSCSGEGGGVATTNPLVPVILAGLAAAAAAAAPLPRKHAQQAWHPVLRQQVVCDAPAPPSGGCSGRQCSVAHLSHPGGAQGRRSEGFRATCAIPLDNM